MRFSKLFKNSASKKGEQIADFIISLGADKTLRQLLMATPKPMSLRLMVDHILVSTAIAIYALNLFKMISKSQKLEKNHVPIMDGMMDRLVYHLEKMSINLRVKDIIVDENEKRFFLREGWTLDEITNIYSVFSVIGDYRMDKYSKAVIEDTAEVARGADGSRMTAKLMQETKRSCGEDDYPYAELKLIYTSNINKIMSKIKNILSL